MLEKFVKTHKKEMRINNCGFDHDPSESLVRSQWQSRSKSGIYLAYRYFVAAFTIFVVTISLMQHLQKHGFGKFFIYLTRWGITINMITGIYGAILVSLWYFDREYNEKMKRIEEVPIELKIYWAIHNTALTISLVITIVYWTALHNDTETLNLSNILSHAANSAIMIIDLFIVEYPLRLYHVIQPITFGIIYGVFSYIYYICGGTNSKGRPYVYKIVDWSKPSKALSTIAIMILITVCVHSFLFWVFKLRVFIHRRLFKEKEKNSSYPMNSNV